MHRLEIGWSHCGTGKIIDWLPLSDLKLAMLISMGSLTGFLTNRHAFVAISNFLFAEIILYLRRVIVSAKTNGSQSAVLAEKPATCPPTAICK